MGEERETLVVVCEAGSKVITIMNDKLKQKLYNTIMTVLAIAGAVLILLSIFVEKIEDIVKWPGYATVWAAIMMKLFNPALNQRTKQTK